MKIIENTPFSVFSLRLRGDALEGALLCIPTIKAPPCLLLGIHQLFTQIVCKKSCCVIISMSFRAPPHNCAKTSRVIFADPNFEKERNSSALFAREISLVTQPSFDCEQGINSQVQTACSNANAIFPVLGIVSCRNERFSLSRKTHVPLWNEPRISHVRLP